MPTQHLGLLVLRMTNRVHSEFAKNQRTLAGRILEPKEIVLENDLSVEVNVEAEKIDVLREQIFRRRIGRIGKKDIGIDRAPDANKMFDEFGHAADTEPARHRARDLVTDQVSEHSWI